MMLRSAVINRQDVVKDKPGGTEEEEIYHLGNLQCILNNLVYVLAW